jgi:hypothetical protein
LPLGPGRTNLLYLVDSSLKLTVRTNMLLLLLLLLLLLPLLSSLTLGCGRANSNMHCSRPSSYNPVSNWKVALKATAAVAVLFPLFLFCRLPLGSGHVNLLYLVDSTLKLTVGTNKMLLLLSLLFVCRLPLGPGRVNLLLLLLRLRRC